MRKRIRHLLNAVTPTVRKIYFALFDDRIATRFCEPLESRVMLSAVTIQGTGGPDTFYIRNDPDTDELLLWHNAPLQDNPERYSGHDIDSFVIDAGDGDDILTLDNSDGDPLRSDALIFHGQGGSDSLIFTGPSTATSRSSYTPSSTQWNTGSVRTGTKLMTFSAVESVSTSNFNRSTLITPNTNDALAIESPSATTNRVAGDSNGVVFSPLTFSNVSTFTLDASTNDGDGSDDSVGSDDITISSDGVRAAGLNSLQVLAGIGWNSLDINGGTTNLDTGAGIGGAYLSVTLNNAAVVNFIKTQHLLSLSLRNSSRANLPSGLFKILFLDALLFPSGNTARLDIADNDLIVHNGVFASIKNQIVRAYQVNSSPHWQGPGITSSTATPGQTAIGFIKASTQPPTRLFDGQEIADTDVLVKFAYEGDNNLDNEVSSYDTITLYSNWGATGATWLDGDFNYDSSVTIADAIDQSSNFGIPKPSVTVSRADYVDEGAPYTLDLAAMSTYTQDQTTYSYGPVSYYTVYWGDDTVQTIPQTTASADPNTHMVTLPVFHIYEDDTGQSSYAVSVFAKGTQMNYYVGSQTVTVDNVPPTLILGGDSAAFIGTPFALSLDASDLGDDSITGWTIDWGDGSDILTLPGDPINQHHTYSVTQPSVTITAHATDEDGGPYTATRILNFVTPAAPDNLAAAAVSDHEIALTWADHSNNETGFQIIVSTEQDTLKTVIVPADQTSYTVSGLDAETTYFIRVLAENEVGTSAESNTASATTLQIPAPDQLSATAASPTQIDLSWQDQSNTEDSFEIQWSTDGTTFAPLAVVAADVSTYQATDLTPGMHYFFQVAAQASNGRSEASAIADVWTLPPSLVGLQLSIGWEPENGDYVTTLNWNDVNGETGYKINWSSDGNSWIQLDQIEADRAGWQDHQIRHGYFRVDAFNSSGATLGTVVHEKTTPTAPTNVTATSTAKGLQLSWTDNANDEIGYHVSIVGFDFFSNAFITLPANSTSYEITGLSPGDTAQIGVTAFNLRGDSEYSDPVEAVGPWMRRGVATSASTLHGEGHCSGWLNTDDRSISLSSALTDDSHDTGYFISTFSGSAVKLAFAEGVLRNGPGYDLVLYSAVPQFPTSSQDYMYMQASLNEIEGYEGQTYTSNNSTWPFTWGIGADQLYYTQGHTYDHFLSDCVETEAAQVTEHIWAFPIDLSVLGVAAGASVDHVYVFPHGYYPWFLLGADAIDDMRLWMDPSQVTMLTNNDREESADRFDYDDDTAIIPSEEESTPVDDDLTKITLDMGGAFGYARHEGMLTLTASDFTSVRLFKSDGTELTQHELDLANPAGYLAGLMNGPVDVWVEGLKADPNFTLTLSYTGPDGIKEKEAQTALSIIDFNFVDTDGDPVSTVLRLPQELLLDKASGDPHPLDLHGAAFKLRLEGASSASARISTDDCWGFDDVLTDSGNGIESSQARVLYSSPDDESSCGSLPLQALQLDSIDDSGVTVHLSVNGAGGWGEFQRKLQSAAVQTVEWETYDVSKDPGYEGQGLPQGVKPNRQIGPPKRDQKIYPERVDWNEDDSWAGMRKQVFAKATLQRAPGQPLAGQTVYFAVYDVDDPSWSSFDDPNDITVGNKAYGIGNDNRRPDHFEKDQGHLGDASPDPNLGDAVQRLQATTDENGVARVVFTVTTQPGNNFKVFATTDRKPLWEMVQANVDGVDTNGDQQHGNPPKKWKVPAGIASSATLTVWRTLHVESEAMKAPPRNQQFDATDREPRGIVEDAGVRHLPFLDTGLFKGNFNPAYVDVVELPGTLNGRRYTKWVYNLGKVVEQLPGGEVSVDRSEVDQMLDAIRDVPNKDDFWTVQILSAYEPTILEDGDHGGRNRRAVGGFASGNHAVVFGEVLRQWSTEQGAVDLETITRRSVVHEALHIFKMPHGRNADQSHYEWDNGPLDPELNIKGTFAQNTTGPWHWWRIRGNLKPVGAF